MLVYAIGRSYKCLSGQHDDSGIPCAMLEWAAGHPICPPGYAPARLTQAASAPQKNPWDAYPTAPWLVGTGDRPGSQWQAFPVRPHPRLSTLDTAGNSANVCWRRNIRVPSPVGDSDALCRLHGRSRASALRLTRKIKKLGAGCDRAGHRPAEDYCHQYQCPHVVAPASYFPAQK
jgi:hypothetical protein